MRTRLPAGFSIRQEGNSKKINGVRPRDASNGTISGCTGSEKPAGVDESAASEYPCRSEFGGACLVGSVIKKRRKKMRKHKKKKLLKRARHKRKR